MDSETLRQEVLSNLSISIETEDEHDYGVTHTIVKVNIYWGDTKIDSATTSIRTA